MKKYKDSFEVQSESIKSGGEGIVTAAQNEVPRPPTTARSPEFTREGNAAVPFVRTLESDARYAAKDSNVSLAGEILAAQKKQRAERASKTIPRTATRAPKRYPIFIIFFLAALLLFGGSFFFFASRQGLPLGDILLIFRPPTLAPAPPADDLEVDAIPSRSLFTAAEEKELIVGEQTDRMAFQTLIENEIAAADPESFVALIPVEVLQAGEEVFHERVDPFRLLTMLNFPIYEALSRNISDYTLGIIGREEASMFLVARTRFFDDGLATMLAWERTMLRDLYGLSHSNSEHAFDGGDAMFKDTVVLGFDARVLTQTIEIADGMDGETRTEEKDIIAYSIVNNEMLVLANSRERLVDIISRLKK
jgi:hypothetical protein